MRPSPVILPVSHYRQIRLTFSTILRVPYSERVGRMRRLCITRKCSSCVRIARMLMQIWEAGFLQKAASGMRSLRIGMPFGFLRKLCPRKVIWLGSWQHPQIRCSETDQRLSFWLNEPTRKALEVRITRLFYASSLQRTLKLAVLVRPGKLLDRLCERQRSKAIPLCPTRSEMKLRSTSWAYLIIESDNSLGRSCVD